MKVRFRFAKVGRLRWTSHRDVARMWERALRRAGLPVAYTSGFSPRPRLSFGLALPTGCESVAEYLDATFDATLEGAGRGAGCPWPGATPDEEQSVGALAALLGPELPEGLWVLAAGALSPGAPSLQEEVTSCTWDIEVPGAERAVLAASLERALCATTLPVHRERKGRRQLDDLRPSVLALTPLDDDGPGSRFSAELATQPRGVRPAELAEALGLELGLARRTCQWIERSGSRREPLAVAAASPDTVLGRAS